MDQAAHRFVDNVGNRQRLALPDSSTGAQRSTYSHFVRPGHVGLVRRRHRRSGRLPSRSYNSFRRGATTRATSAGVKEDDIDWLCRWNTGGEETGGAPLSVLYSDRTQLLETYLRFSKR
jgi:hypothetical protein